jgi:hypothetical protein
MVNFSREVKQLSHNISAGNTSETSIMFADFIDFDCNKIRFDEYSMSSKGIVRSVSTENFPEVKAL